MTAWGWLRESCRITRWPLIARERLAGYLRESWLKAKNRVAA
jgi:hypothetical protein